jgi:hypothetical protein
MNLQEGLKMSSMRLKACLGTFHHGLSISLKDLGITVEGMDGVHTTLVKRFQVVGSS